ncbi:MAG TPA: metal-sensing transcriptional repressor [Patescibacteria group bacterium]|nr:metal-sensing transcriptional repressor [Patescibacteria group bacterium]
MEKTDLDKRINRLVGQIEGVRRMIHKKREATAVLQQILAAREALSKIGILLMKQALLSSDGVKPDKIERIIREVFRM